MSTIVHLVSKVENFRLSGYSCISRSQVHSLPSYSACTSTHRETRKKEKKKAMERLSQLDPSSFGYPVDSTIGEVRG